MKKREIGDTLTFLRRTKGLETVQRYGSSLRGKQNTVAEHSWRLGLMAFVIVAECNMDLDLGRVLALALLHDIAEAKTGDIDAYTKITGGERLIKEKMILEEAAMCEMTSDLSFGDSIYNLWREYEEQATVEAKFVKALDKIEGFLHIAEVGVEKYIPEAFYADYATDAVAVFDEATDHVPELKDFLDVVKKNLRVQFEKRGVEWIDDPNT